ncbi:HTTM domain-containing protein [Streptomyces varsoviensis]|uniref:HTTM domain-containing protein n=1 Tax=Streptomyces varsoviensis TaxID=67373 RepID=UPI0033DC4A95
MPASEPPAFAPSAAQPSEPPDAGLSVTPPPAARPPSSAPLAVRLDRALTGGLARVTGTSLGPYQTAVIRIGYAFTWLFFLVREWPHRHELYGPDGTWDWDMARRLVDDNHSFTALMWSDGAFWFEAVYCLAIASSALLLLGWRTRTMSVLFMLGVLSLQNRSVFVGDGGDNVIHLMSMYLVLTRCGQVWSLDARRARRGGGRGPDRDTTGVVLWAVAGLALSTAQFLGVSHLSWTANGPLPGLGWATVLWGLWLVHAAWWLARRYAPGEPRTVLDAFAHLAHNSALLVIMVQVCLIYATAGWYKVQGSRWQDGTALFYPMHLDYFSPWPALSDALTSSGLITMAVTYGTVIVQVAFPFTLFNRRIKNVLLALMIVEHLSIAFFLGLPFFSLAMITADAVFLPTNFLRAAGRRLGGLRDRLPAGRRLSLPEQRTGDGEAAPRTLVG